MFVVELTYKVDFPTVDKLVPEHLVWLDKMFAAKQFLCSGAKKPRDGGFIIALTQDLQQLKQILAEDPFHIREVAEYRITEFTPTRYQPDFAKFVTQ